MLGPETSNLCIRFGSFAVQLGTRELYCGGHKIPLQDKPFRLLAILLDRPGELVTREELRERLWPEHTFVDFEHSINTAIRKLRATLQDDAEVPRFIETLPRRGYRFIAPLSPSGHFAPGERLLVLPFESLCSHDESFSGALTERVIAQLGTMGQSVEVIAPLSVMHCRHPQDTRALCEKLRADYVLAGSVICAESHVRITAKLIRGEDQRCLWSETYTHGQHEIFLVQDEVSANIARAMLRQFAPAEAPVNPG